MHDPEKRARPEILSPAGSLEAFFAAMEGGADAVYCGLKDFSARAKAKNFSLSQVEKMLGYAHSRDRKVYITLNTLVKEKELPALIETLASLEAMGADAVIVQDLAVWRLVREHFPALELHASTQMTVHNAAGVKMLERMGFKRGVLARELSLAEIADIRAQTTLELEHFVHGALCFCYSGQCFFSSWLGGKSGNRGRCAQPCRRRYSYRGQEGYYFSTNDLSAIDLLPELAAAGVISFKIEGRMKSAEYVSSVVAAYRSVLDAPASRRVEAARSAKEKLKSSFGRPPTQGFLPGGVPADIAIPSIKGATGRFLGEVASEQKGTITFKSRDRLHVGDRLRVQPKSDKAGTAFTVKELRVAGKGAMSAPSGAKVTVPSPFSGIFRPGDAVFKVSSDQAFTLSEAACRRRLEGASPPAAPLRLTISLENDFLTLRGSYGAISLERSYPVVTFAAEERPLSVETLEGVFARSGASHFSLETLEVGNLPPVVIPPSRLKAIRRDFYAEMQREVDRGRQRQKKEHLDDALSSLLPPSPPSREGRPVVSVGIESVRDAHLLGDAGVDRLLIPLNAANVQIVFQSERRLRGREEKVVWEIPFILMQHEWEQCREGVQLLTQKGYRNFRLNNLGHFPLFDGLEERVVLSTGWRLFSLNSQALLAWHSLGAVEATLYLEDDRENLRDLLCRKVGMETALTVYAAVPLITSRIPIKGVRSDTPVFSDRGEAYRVQSRSGQSILTSETDLSLLGRLKDLQALGCSRFVVELGHLGPFSVQGKSVLDALRQGREVPGTSPFNYDVGME